MLSIVTESVADLVRISLVQVQTHLNTEIQLKKSYSVVLFLMTIDNM